MSNKKKTAVTSVEVPDDLGPAMLALGERERKFVVGMILTAGNASKSARMAGYSDTKEACKVRGHYLRHREDVIAAMQEMSFRLMKSLTVPVVAALENLVRKPDHPQHVRALALLMPHVGFHERMAVDVNVSGTVKVDHTTQALDDLKKMIELGVPRERLLETFGYSGLSRYEKMLADKSKVIEHDVAAPSERDL